MADETDNVTTNPETQPTPPQAPAPDIEAIKAQHAAELAATRAELDAHKQTLAAVQSQFTGGGQPQMVNAGAYQIPKQVVDDFVRQGMSEKDAVDAAKVLMPFLNTYGAPLAQQQQQLQSETKFVRAAMDKSAYPDWTLLGETIDTLRAKYPGIEPKDAYDWARGIAYDKLTEARQTEQAAAARSRDASNQGFLTASPHTRLDLSDTVIRSAADIATLSDDDAQKLWDKLGNTPF